MAVCLLPGTEVAFENEVEHERMIGLLPNVRRKTKLARFRQINKDSLHTYHDALEFADGVVVLVTRLTEGQRATVLQLPVASSGAEAAHGIAAERREAARRSTVT